MLGPSGLAVRLRRFCVERLHRLPEEIHASLAAVVRAEGLDRTARAAYAPREETRGLSAVSS